MGSKCPLGASHCGVSADVVLATLDRLLNHEQLKLSDRNKRFLRFVVSEVLEGRGERIKAYTIGVDVFGRGADFDPSNDPIVRIEATRIRSALSTYYEKFGKDEPIKFLMPPGSYIPILHVEDNEEARGPTTQGYLDANFYLPLDKVRLRPAVVVTMKIGPARAANGMFIELTKQAIAARLHGMRFRVFLGPMQERAHNAQTMDLLICGPDPVYALEGAFYSIAEDHLQSWSLTDLKTGELLDTAFEMRLEKCDLSCETALAVADRAAGMIERSLAVHPSHCRPDENRRIPPRGRSFA
jgi:hypothetical protein